jgi:hypothetical protein
MPHGAEFSSRYRSTLAATQTSLNNAIRDTLWFCAAIALIGAVLGLVACALVWPLKTIAVIVVLAAVRIL